MFHPKGISPSSFQSSKKNAPLSSSLLEELPSVIIVQRVFPFLSYAECANVFAVNQHWHALSGQDSTWRDLCKILATRDKVYIGHIPSVSTREVFVRAITSFLKVWQPSPSPEGVFRNDCLAHSVAGNGEAEGEGEGEEKRMVEEERKEGEALAIKVFVRFRPEDLGDVSPVQLPSAEYATVGEDDEGLYEFADSDDLSLDCGSVESKTFNIEKEGGADEESEEKEEKEEEEGKGQKRRVVLPLHQRLNVIMMAKKCTKMEALRILFHKKGMDDVRDPWETAYLNDRGFNDKVVERMIVKKVLEKTAAQDPSNGSTATAAILACTDRQVLVCAPIHGLKQFHFDRVFDGAHGSQSQVYASVQRVVGDFMNGVNGSVISYGQTGSGKTHTMFGPDHILRTGLPNDFLSEKCEHGIIPRACTELLSAMAARRAYGVDAKLLISYIEVYGDTVTDLLNEGKQIGHWQGVAAFAVLEGAAMVAAESPSEVVKILEKGEGAKRRAATAMNERSSRAHTLVFLSLQQRTSRAGASLQKGKEAEEAVAKASSRAFIEHADSRTSSSSSSSSYDIIVRSRFCFADLGGSEQVKISKVEGARLNEAILINKGLLALKSCISALNDYSLHVPYHNSKLTELLRETLGGESQTVVMVTASKDDRFGAQSLQSLRFGESCMKVETRANAGTTSQMIIQALEELEKDIAAMEEAIKAKEKWETKIVERQDLDGIERVSVTVPVGAEMERKRLESLLQRKASLFGEE